MVVAEDLAKEYIWADKYKCEDAERAYYESLSKKTGKVQSAASQDSTAGDGLMSRIHVLEKQNADLKQSFGDLKQLIGKLESRILSLEKGGITATGAAPTTDKPAAAADDDDDIDLFGSDSEDDAAAERVRQERLAAYAAKKAKKPGPIAKSSIVLDVKPWDDETDMGAMEKQVRTIAMDGLVWGAAKLVPVGYGIKKLQIMCVVEDEKVSVEELQECIEAFEDLVQSVDIAAFNKI